MLPVWSHAMSEPLTDARLAELERLAREATSGPWTTDGPFIFPPRDTIPPGARENYYRVASVSVAYRSSAEMLADAAYIAAANPSTVLAMLDEIRLLHVILGDKLQDDARLAEGYRRGMLAGYAEGLAEGRAQGAEEALKRVKEMIAGFPVAVTGADLLMP